MSLGDTTAQVYAITDGSAADRMSHFHLRVQADLADLRRVRRPSSSQRRQIEFLMGLEQRLRERQGLPLGGRTFRVHSP